MHVSSPFVYCKQGNGREIGACLAIALKHFGLEKLLWGEKWVKWLILSRKSGTNPSYRYNCNSDGSRNNTGVGKSVQHVISQRRENEINDLCCIFTVSLKHGSRLQSDGKGTFPIRKSDCAFTCITNMWPTNGTPKPTSVSASFT